MVDEVLNATIKLKAKALERREDGLIIINTDGWIDGDASVKYKVRLIEMVDPDYIVAIQTGGELDPIVSSVKERNIITVESPENIKRRDPKTRRLLRGFAYKKHLKGSKICSFPLSWIKVEGSLHLDSQKRDQLREKMQDVLKTEVLCCEETFNSIVLIIGKKAGLDEEAVKLAEMKMGKKIIVLQKGDEKGLLVSLEGPSGNMLGIGTIYSVDFRNRIIKIRTPVNKPVSKIKIGRIKLDPEGNEMGVLFEGLSMR